jgi:hypothetical protein
MMQNYIYLYEGARTNEKLPIIMLTGSAETPRETEISTSNKSPPIKIANATHNGLIHLYKQKLKADIHNIRKRLHR